jgi:Bacterial PH domain
MRFHPPRLAGLLLGLLFLAISAAATAVGVVRLGNTGYSPWIAVWIALPVLGMPAAIVVAYRLFGLLTASYQVDRDGIRLRWGLAVEQVALVDVAEVRVPDPGTMRLRPGSGIWWPGCVVGRRVVQDLGTVEFFASTGAAGMLLLRLHDRWVAISPGDRDGFRQAYVDMIRMGSLERIPAIRLRPDFLFNRLWADRWARALVLAGLALCLLLLGYLAYQASALTAQVPFGFDPYGEPEGFVSPTQLLLLPLLAGLCWSIDFVLGLWLYRKDNQRPLAYGLWGTAVLVGGLLWGASLQLLAYAR